MVLFLVISVLTALAFVNRRLAGSLLYPPASLAALWSVYLVLYSLSGNLFFKVGDDTLFFYMWCACAFSAGGIITLLFARDKRVDRVAAPVSDRRKKIVRRILDGLLVILVIGLPFYVHYIMALLADGGLVEFFVTIRAKMVELSDDAIGSVSFMDNLAVLANAVPLLVYFEDDGSRGRRWRTWLSLVLALAYNLLTAGRAGFVTLILSLFALHWLKEKRPNWKVLTALGMAFIIIFAALAILVRKGDVEKEATFVENLPAVFDGFLWYALGGIVAFDTIYHHPTRIEANQNLDRDLKVVARKFDSHVEVPSIHSQYTTIGPGGNMNIYTAYFSYYPEFGFAGTSFILFLLGGILTWVYLLAGTGSSQAMILYSILFSGVVLTGYAENLVLNLNFLGKMFLVTFLLYRFGAGTREKRETVALVAAH